MGRRGSVAVGAVVLGVALLFAEGAAGAVPRVGTAAALQADSAARTAEDVLVAQLAAFNAADVNALAANVAEDFAWIAVDSDGAAVQLVGREQFRRSMQEYFSSVPGPRAEITGMLVSGAFVSVIERAYWIGDDGSERSQDALAVYEVRQGLIYRVWYYPTPESAAAGGA